MLRLSVALVLIASTPGCGSAVLGRARDLSSRAVEEHLADGRGIDTSDLVDVPPGLAWNSTVDAVRGVAPVASASFDQRRIETQWVYGAVGVRDGVATQPRARSSVQLVGSDARSYQARVTTEGETRTRETCTEPSDWTPARASADERIEHGTREALEHLQTVGLAELRFPGSPDAVLPIVSDVVLRRWGLAPAPNGLAFPLAGGWRDTTATRDGVDVTVRSSVQVSVRSALAPSNEQPMGGATPGLGAAPPAQFVHFDVHGILQWHGEQGDEGTAWLGEDGERVVADFFARLAERLPPARVSHADVTPMEPSAADPPAPDLPAPPDPLRGSYGLYIRAVQLPLHSPDGLDWDVGGMIGTLIRYAPAVIRVLRLAYGDFSSALEFVVAAARAAGDRGIEDRIAGMIADRLGQTSAPDIQMALTLPNQETVGLDGPDNSHVAAWTDPIPLGLNGEALLPWAIWDRDPFEPDLVGRGTFSLQELANACEPVCQALPGGGRVCAELRRVRR